MPPKKIDSASQDDIAAIKDTVSRLEHRFSAFEEFMIEESTKTTILLRKIEEMERISREKDIKIKQLEDRVDDLEQYSRREDIIISGLKPDISFKEIVTGEPDSETEYTKTIVEDRVEQQIIKFMKENDIPLEEEEISACHTLGKKRDDGTQNIIVRFVNRKTKTRILSKGANLKGTNVYVNEHLTKKNADLAKAARKLKKDGKIHKTWTRDCKVFIKETMRGKSKLVRTSADLDF
jgi:hypothetical protein